MNAVPEHKGSGKRKIDIFIFLFSLTLFLSASLTFIIQPMIGKMLLPLVGGSPSGWLVTMAYFQLVLLAGYLIAHLLSRVAPVTHVLAVIALLLIGIVALPLHLDVAVIQSPNLPEAFGVLFGLFLGLTLPCVALFTLSPSLQRLFDAGSTRTGRDPYFLFAASNTGSLGGLLAYPLVIERAIGLTEQRFLWQAAYGILIALCLLCLALSWKQARNVKPKKAAATASISWKTRGRWVLLAFIPSSLMLGVTAHITTDTGAVPFFWVLPLALYLLTFILAFANGKRTSLPWIDYLQSASIALLVAFFVKTPAVVSSPALMTFPILAFFVTTLYCHFTLAAERPVPQKLTEFYLWIAIGGALGGSFNTFVAPFIFPLPIEFMLVALLSCLIHPLRPFVEKRSMQIAVTAAIMVAAGAAFFYIIKFNAPPDDVTALIVFTILTLALLAVSLAPRALSGLALIVGALTVMTHVSNMLDVHRDFYGVSRVFEYKEPEMTVRVFYHGSTVHGQQEVAPKVDVTPNGYYDVDGPLGDLMDHFKPNNVAIIGMGAGTSLCYRAPHRQFTVYELNPIVPLFAQKWFDFIKLCGKPNLRIGDGRRMLEADQGARYDMLLIDAFTSDAIPLHLLTKEAFGIYLARLKPNGVLAIHVSNRFYDLQPAIANLAAESGLHGMYRTYKPTAARPLAAPTRWVALAHDTAWLAPLRKRDWQDMPSAQGQAWTDDFSDAISALRFLQPQANDVTNAQTH